MIQEMWKLYLSRQEYFHNLLIEHLQLSAISIVLALVIGLALGILIAQQDRFSLPVLGTINFIYTIPSIALFGILLPLTGLGNNTAIIALTVYALLPIVRNTYAGLKNIDPTIIEAGIGMGSTEWQLLWKIKLPLALPVIMAGVRNMVVMVIATCGIASFIGAGGLGVAIFRGITTYQLSMTYLGSLMIAAVALCCDILLGKLEKQITLRINGTLPQNRKHKN
ncbi:MAG: ABC transporter permease [Peptococcaceae bacterium]|nr:ABC transporter permease [Peptococcaceae bacterium]MBQ5652454.1 ABC transporter permease [Peptococcaceae bacterium]MBQ5682210.1 ABC transporter permease [Peptococcaceae bacterium]